MTVSFLQHQLNDLNSLIQFRVVLLNQLQVLIFRFRNFDLSSFDEMLSSLFLPDLLTQPPDPSNTSYPFILFPFGLFMFDFADF